MELAVKRYLGVRGSWSDTPSGLQLILFAEIETRRPEACEASRWHQIREPLSPIRCKILRLLFLTPILVMPRGAALRSSINKKQRANISNTTPFLLPDISKK